MNLVPIFYALTLNVQFLFAPDILPLETTASSPDIHWGIFNDLGLVVVRLLDRNLTLPKGKNSSLLYIPHCFEPEGPIHSQLC